MAQRSIYEDIARRTGGDIYIGVVGPVRSGKSTFITRFMQEMVLPSMTDEAARERARDEMPQSAAGKTVMTTEPKFVPEQAVSLSVGEGIGVRVKMIDCVGYMIPEARGAQEDGEARMVSTPWSETPMPFAEAAEYGTRKVMQQHATIGMLVSCDGSIGEISRASYEEAEARLVREMKASGKPFALLLNSAEPSAPRALALAEELEKRYDVPVALINCLTLNAKDVSGILQMVLGEFPVCSVRFSLPAFAAALPAEHPIRERIGQDVCRLAGSLSRMGEVKTCFAPLVENEAVERVEVKDLDMGSGCATVSLSLNPSLYFDVLSELSGEEVRDEAALFALVKELSKTREKYERVREALESVEETGYGIVMPRVEDLSLEKPTIIKQSGGFGVRMCASAPSMHLIRADIRTELNPIVGTEQQSEEFVKNVLADFEGEPKKLWESNMFGKTLYELVNDGLHEKLTHIPADARKKLSETLERIVNDGANGLICVLL